MRHRSGTQQGHLLVLEGPDGVGKTTLARALEERLLSLGVDCEVFAFPGNEKGTLGRLVYDLHHNHGKYGLSNLNPVSLQVLHIAAHIDAIEGRIRPYLERGRTVILDRYWWSTWVYGKAGGVPVDSLNAMVDLERLHWAGLTPDAVFLIQRVKPHRIDVNEPKRFAELARFYAELSGRSRSPVHILRNEGTISESVDEMQLLIGCDAHGESAQ